MTMLEICELQMQLKEILDLGLIRPIISPWGVLIIFVKKKECFLWLCIDYKDLKKDVVKNRYPIPITDVLFDQMKGSFVF